MQRATTKLRALVKGIDAIFAVGIQFHFMKKALEEVKRTGDYTGLTQNEWITVRKQVEDMSGLEDYYRIEQATVEKMYGRGKGGKR